MIIHKEQIPEIRYHQMLAKLRSSGCRITTHRVGLLRLIAASEGHPTAAQLYERLKQQYPTVSLASIYKTLSLLKDHDEILEIDLHGESRYDGRLPYPHPHLICTRCQRIIDGDALPASENIIQQIADLYGFKVSQQQQVFFGLCADCQTDH